MSDPIDVGDSVACSAAPSRAAAEAPTRTLDNKKLPTPVGQQSVKRLGVSVGISVLLCVLIGWLGAPTLTGPTDIIGYPTFANFNFEPMFWKYRLIVYGFPLFTIVAYVSFARYGPLRAHSPRPAKRTIGLVEPAASLTSEPKATWWSALPRLMLPTAVVVAACGARTGHCDLLAIIAGVVYVGMVVAVAEARARRSACPRWEVLAWVNGMGGAVLAVLGLWFVAANTVVQTATGTRSFPWLDWWLPVLAIIAIVSWAASQLRKGRAARDVERILLAVVVGATALFLAMSELPDQIIHFQGFDDAQELGGASLLSRGYFPWRDMLFIHGLFPDVLTGSLGRAVIADTIWGVFAFHTVVLIPLAWVSAYFFAVWVSRGNLWLLALTFGVIAVVRPLFELVLTVPPLERLPAGLLATSERFLAVPIALIVLGETIRRRSAAWAVGLTLLLFALEIFVPETLFVSGPALTCVVASDFVHRKPKQTLWVNLRLTRWCIGTGLVAIGAWAAFLVTFGALRAFIDYYIVFGPGHNLEGAIPPSWVGPAEWAMIVIVGGCVLSTIWLVAVKFAKRADWQARDWVAVAAAAFGALYLEKAFGRFDASHVWQVYGASLPLVLLWIGRLFDWWAPRIAASRHVRPRLSHQYAYPTVLVAIVAIALAIFYAGPVRKVAGQHHLSGVTVAGFARLGFSPPGAIDTELLSDLDVVIHYYAGDTGPVFDMTNSLGYLYFVLGRAPGTRFVHVSMAIPAYSQGLLIDELKKSQPPLVIYDASSIGLPIWDGISNNVRHYEVSEFVLHGWTPVLRTHGVLVMARNDLASSRPLPVIATSPRTADLYFSGPPCDWGATPNYLHIPASDRASTFQVRPVAPRTVVHYSGWALDPATNRPADSVLLADGDRVVGTVTPWLNRPDVAHTLHQPDSASGFEYMATFETAIHPSAYLVGADGVAHPLRGSPGEFVPTLRMSDGRQVRVAPTAGGNLDFANSDAYTVGEFNLSPGTTLRDYDLVKLSSSDGLGGARAVITDEPGRLYHGISARWLDRAGRELTLRVGSCAQWYGYVSSKPLFVMQTSGPPVTSVTLSSRNG